MKVIKKSGRVQEFDLEKIKLTLERVSDEVNKPFTDSDINKLTKAIHKVILAIGKEYVHSFQIHQIVVDELKAAGFTHIAQAYDNYQRKYQPAFCKGFIKRGYSFRISPFPSYIYFQPTFGLNAL